MLTYEGAVKVIDFGIAKADSNSEATQAGTIKGKLSYLAPEYLEGEELDPRYDEFAVGITLWEMLCSRKLFKASNDLAVLKKIQECKVPPPSSINPNVPKELDETAYVDGYSFVRFFTTIFIPTIKSGVGVAAFFCFMFSWVELLLAKTLTAVAAKPIAATMTKTASSAGYELGLLAAAGTLTIIPGAIVIYFVRNYIAKGFAMGRV